MFVSQLLWKNLNNNNAKKCLCPSMFFDHILQLFPISVTCVERLFSKTKLIKTHLPNQLTQVHLDQLQKRPQRSVSLMILMKSLYMRLKGEIQTQELIFKYLKSYKYYVFCAMQFDSYIITSILSSQFFFPVLLNLYSLLSVEIYRETNTKFFHFLY